MKLTNWTLSLTLCAAAFVLSGCGKSEPAAPPPAESPKTVTDGVVTGAKEAVTEAATEVKQAAEKAAADVSNQAQSLIDQAKSYVADKKYQDALNTLNQLANTQLTPEQQKLVDDLKAQIKSALSSSATSEATKALGGALGGQK